MPDKISIGIEDFEEVILKNLFYVDKTDFIREWWECGDKATLITRPRRFGKTLNMSMIEKFFSVEFSGREELFSHLSIWKYPDYRVLQGTYPVLFLSFSDIKENSFPQVRKKICETIVDLYDHYNFLTKDDFLTEREKQYFNRISSEMDDADISISLRRLSGYLCRFYQKKVIILVDEYDTPMLEAYAGGFWEELSGLIRSLFNASFKNNPYLERALMTGITRVSKESIFSDLNNLKVVTTTSDEYASCFGFSQEEVFAALEEYGFSERKEEVKDWYDGFTFGTQTDFYNPWSVINFLDTGKLYPFWANTSENKLIGQLVRESSREIKISFEDLLCGKSIQRRMDDQLVYEQLQSKESALWSLLLAVGYLKTEKVFCNPKTGEMLYTISLTNKEVRIMFADMIRGWFSDTDSGYNDFIRALLKGDSRDMNSYMNRIARTTFSFFDTAGGSDVGPEKFYHGFVLGLIVDLEDRYIITSNRESGYGRYDVMLEPIDVKDNAIIMEFKVQDSFEEKNLMDTAQAALDQIERKQYETSLIQRGIPRSRIRKYGFAFCGKTVLIKEKQNR